MKTSISVLFLIVIILVLPSTVGIMMNRSSGKNPQCSNIISDTKLNSFNPSVIGEEIDQSQEKSDSFYKIYEKNWFAQSFTPTMAKLSQVELLMNRHEKSIVKKSVTAKYFKIVENTALFENIQKRSISDLGNIVVEIYSSLEDASYERLARKILTPEEIPENSDGHWVTFDFSDTSLRLGQEYYLVIHAGNGDSDNYYSLYFGNGNPYRRGKGYSSTDGGMNWNDNSNLDFCFRTYGEYTGDEPDGVTNRWAVLFDAFSEQKSIIDDAAQCLINHGWKREHIKVIYNATKTKAQSAISWLDDRDDQDDIGFVCSNSHGFEGGISLADNFLYYDKLDNWLDKCGSHIFYSISACHSGSAISALGGERRFIVSACDTDEVGYTASFLIFLFCETNHVKKFGYNEAPVPNGAFARKECDLNNDGWVSAEEAFTYAKNWTIKFHNEFLSPNYPIHPQIYDGIDGELLITQL